MGFIDKIVEKSGLAGWVEMAPIDTYWIGDDAIDRDASDLERYGEMLDKSALIVRKGQTPQPVRVALISDAGGLMAVQEQLSRGMNAEAVTTAFALCVRFPGVEAANPQSIGGQHRLPAAFMAEMSRSAPGIIMDLGSWVIDRSLLSDQEKKASSPASGPTGSSTPPTTAPSATQGVESSKGAQTSEPKADPAPQTA